MRGKQSVRDMVLSVAVIGVVVAGIYLFVPHSGGESVKTVSYRVELGQARRAAPYPVAGPVGLSRQWRATSVNYDSSDPKAVHWHLGFVDPQDQYASIEQTNDTDPAQFVSDTTQNSHHAGSQTVGATTWQRYEGGRYRALVRTEHGVTTMVDGTAPYDQLARLAGSLRTS